MTPGPWRLRGAPSPRTPVQVEAPEPLYQRVCCLVSPGECWAGDTRAPASQGGCDYNFRPVLHGTSPILECGPPGSVRGTLCKSS